MEISDARYEALLDAARREGHASGKSAASWYDVTEDNAPRIVRGIDDGDPALLDTFPYLDLSGQWADGETDRGVLLQIAGDEEELDVLGGSEEGDDLIAAFRSAFDAAVVDDIERRARALVSDASEPKGA